jgi:uncharacterized protein YhjY with autotransporter beta-barrel domain
VASGGSVVVDLSYCAGFGTNGYQSPPQHGVNDSRNNNSTGLVYYTNNGDGSTSDSFSIIDGEDLSVIPFTVTVQQAGPSVTTTTLPAPVIGTAYSRSLAASGGSTPYTWSLTGGALPAGLTLSSAGVISGTPTQAGSFNPVFTVTDSANRTASRTIAVNVSAPTLAITPTTLPDGVAGTAYSRSLGTSGGTAPYTYTLSAGTPPPGVTISSAGNVTGTPSTPGNYSFTVRSTDSSTGVGAPFSTTRTFSVTISAPTITVAPATLPNPTVGVAYSQTVTAAGGTAPYTFAVTAGALPAGMSLAGGGALSGTPTAAGTFNFTVTATDNGGFTGSRAYTITVAAPTIAVAPTTLPGATAGQAYSTTVTASGGTPAYSYAVTAGSLPSGITMSQAGVVSGTSTVAGSFNFTVTATDSSTGAGAPFSGARSYMLTVNAPTVVVAPTTLPNLAVGAAYSQNLAASGGTAPYAFAVTAGATPAGVTLSAGGVLSGTPTASGTFNFTVTATDSSGFTGNRAYTVTVTAPTVTVAPSNLPNALAGQAYSSTLTATGGTAPYSFAITAGSLPSGISLSPAGVLSGTSTVSGTFNFTVSATDSSSGAGAPFSGSRAYSLTVDAPTVVVAPATLSNPSVATAYSQTITASGGTAPYTFAITAGATPSGLSLNAAGVLSGTPTAAGTFNFTVTATDGNGFNGARAYTITVGGPTLVLTPTGQPGAHVGQPYTASFSTTGGTAPYHYTVSGSLPTGLTLADNGTLSGTPTQAGSFPVAIHVTDSSTGAGSPFTASVNVTLAVDADALVLAPASPALSAIYGVSNSLAFTSSGGSAPRSLTLTGALPAGMSFDASTGVLSGTPTVTGSFPFTVTVTDGSLTPATLSRNYTLTIAAVTVIVAPATLPGGTVGTPYSQTISASGGAAPYSFTATGLPAGLTLSTGGVLSGTPTASGSFNLAVSVADAHGTGGSASYTLSVVVQAPLAGASSQTVAANSGATAVTLPLSGGAATSVAVATQATHGSATASGTSISYMPAAGYSGPDSFTYTATNSSGTSAPATVSLTVTAPTLVLTPGAGALPVGMVGTAYSQTISTSGGTAPYSFTATGLPAGLTLSTGGVLSGTPTANGSFTLAVSVTDAHGATGSASYALDVASLPAPVVSNPTPVSVSANTQTQAGQKASIVLSSFVSGSYTNIQIVSQPQHGTVVLSQSLAMRSGGSPLMMMAILTATTGVPAQTIAVYTPEAGFHGTDSFSFVAVGPGGTSAAATATIEVVGHVPTAAAQTVAATDGQAVDIDLTKGATEGPFTGAAIVRVTPADTATAEIVTPGTGMYHLRVTPRAHASGAIQVTYTLTNSVGTSAPATVTVNVTARPDPSTDAVVRAISEAQYEAARRFSRTQVSNFMSHAESLHGADCGTSRNGIQLTSTDRVRTDHLPGQSYDPSEHVKASRDHEGTPDIARSGDQNRPSAECRSAISVWTGGAIGIGTRDATTDRSKINATTSGVSGGVDMHVTEGLTVGVGGGGGWDRSTISGGKGHVAADTSMIAAYASLSPAHGTYVDGMIGRGWLHFATRRLDATTLLITNGDRGGSYTTGALAAGIDQSTGLFRWQLYGRGEYLHGTLDAYSELGTAIYDLRFDQGTLRSLTGIVGFKLTYRQATDIGVVTGRLRGEWQHEFSTGARQGLDYADVAGSSFYSFTNQGWGREQFLIGPGIDLALPTRWAFGLDLGVRASDGERAGTAAVRVKKAF